ncbi:MAG: zf-HC2 domain-containing protein [Myxococcota bacterium]
MNEAHDHAVCREVHDHASAFVEGVAIGPELERVRAHLEMCPPCMEYVRQIGLTVEVLHELAGVEGRAARVAVLDLYDRWRTGA